MKIFPTQRHAHMLEKTVFHIFLVIILNFFPKTIPIIFPNYENQKLQIYIQSFKIYKKRYIYKVLIYILLFYIYNSHILIFLLLHSLPPFRKNNFFYLGTIKKNLTTRLTLFSLFSSFVHSFIHSSHREREIERRK